MPEHGSPCRSGVKPVVTVVGWEAHLEVVQKLVNAFVGTLRLIRCHSPEEVTINVPRNAQAPERISTFSSYATGVGVFNADGLMKP
jgi:NitT/TauT family transport system substrate-binding protein